jgi:adenylate cyclase
MEIDSSMKNLKEVKIKLIKGLKHLTESRYLAYVKFYHIQFLVILCLIWVFVHSPIIKAFFNADTFLTDFMYQAKYLLNKQVQPPKNIVIVDLDTESLWLLDRPDYLSEIIEAIAIDGEAKVIGLDILYDALKHPKPPEKRTEVEKLVCPASSSLPEEMKLACQIEKTNNVILAISHNVVKGKVILEYPLKFLQKAAWGMGYIGLRAGYNKIIRKAPLIIIDTNNDNQLIYSFALSTAIYARTKGNPEHLPVINKQYVDFYGKRIYRIDHWSNEYLVQPGLLGPNYMFQYIKAVDIREKLNNSSYLKNTFQNKIVLIGSSSIYSMDLKPTPYTKFNTHDSLSGLMPGVEFQANYLNALLNNNFFRNSPFWFNSLWVVFFLTAGIIALLHSKRRYYSVLFTIGLIMINILFAFLLFNNLHMIMPAGSTAITLLIAMPILLSYKFITVDRLFSRYVSTDVANFIWKNRDKIVISGEKKYATVLFSDIRGFTSLSESKDPGEILNILNEYFDRMASVIYKNNGNLNKFIGDGIMAIYGVPLSTINRKQDALNSVYTSLEMIEELRLLNKKWIQEKRITKELEIGIGIHSGELIAGNIGSTQRVEYSAIGDTVNLTSRLEGLTKEFEANIIISEETYSFIHDEFRLQYLGDTAVKGRKQTVKIYTISNDKESL